MPYTALVIKGKGRGQSVVGFPTFNLSLPKNFNLKEGIYASRVWIEGKEYRGALHFGESPTFDDADTQLEIFVIDYNDNTPVHELTFEVGTYLRPIATFMSADELHHQIELDVKRVRNTTL